jgi:ribosomal peptide maturation radical SAM protein 1
MAGTSSSVLLITMPWATPIHPSLGIALLSTILDQAGLPAEQLYGNLLLPRSTRPTVYGLADPGYYDDRSAGLSFVPHLYPHVTPEAIANAVAERHLRIISRDGQLPLDPVVLRWKRDGKLRQALIDQTLEDIRHGGVCLERAMDHIAAGNYDVIGMSLTFETQLVASLALARLIKQRWPDKKIILGGAACAAAQGLSMVRSFADIDAVCLGEGDAIIVPLVKALRGEGDLAGISNLAYRADGAVRTTPRAEPLSDLDWLPVPNYDPYLAQKAKSSWSDTRSVLMFETSRGCWWGEKHLCSFCGLNAEALVYRSKSPARMLDELMAFRRRWSLDDGLQAVDNILDTRYFEKFVPGLIAQQRENKHVSIFFEIKSNLRLWQMFQLAMAGMTALQPGIESFSDHILKLMDKGATAFQQVVFIKWAQQTGITPAYNILLRNPGETIADYRAMIELIPFISHLQPPNGIANMQLERFSPYFLRPAQFGIRNVRPKPHYREMFPDERVDLDELVYQFDYDHDDLDAPELVTTRRELMVALGEWQASYQPHRLTYFVLGTDVLLVDRRGPREVSHRLRDLAAALFLFIDQGKPFSRIQAQFAAQPETALRALLEQLVEWRVVYADRDKDAYLAVAVRVYQTAEELTKHYEEELARAQQRRANPYIPIRLHSKPPTDSDTAETPG